MYTQLVRDIFKQNPPKQPIYELPPKTFRIRKLTVVISKGVLTKGTIIEVNVSELGLVTAYVLIPIS